MQGVSSAVDLDQLAKQYFVDELGLPPEGIPVASRNIVGFFEALLRIDQRLNDS